MQIYCFFLTYANLFAKKAARYPSLPFFRTPFLLRVKSSARSGVRWTAVEHCWEGASTFFNAHSDGEKQRILIAKALAQQTPIILLDEPTAHLDLPHRILILRLLRRLAHEQGKTILISTHELDLALALSDRILLMTPGRGVQLDTAENLKKADAFTAAFGMDIFSPLG